MPIVRGFFWRPPQTSLSSIPRTSGYKARGTFLGRVEKESGRRGVWASPPVLPYPILKNRFQLVIYPRRRLINQLPKHYLTYRLRHRPSPSSWLDPETVTRVTRPWPGLLKCCRKKKRIIKRIIKKDEIIVFTCRRCSFHGSRVPDGDGLI